MEPLSRPTSPTSFAERARAWIEWFGVGRLLAASLATAVVCGGAFWLVSSPPPSTEASLPMATSTTVVERPDASLDPTTTALSAVLVHVAGAVIEPGVYELRPGAPDPRRDRGRRRADRVGRLERGEPGSGGRRRHAHLRARGRRGGAGRGDDRLGPGVRAPAGPVDVNRATADELEELPGVGPATAAAIVTERERNGPFADIDDLDRVPGIGPAKLAALRDLVTT